MKLSSIVLVHDYVRFQTAIRHPTIQYGTIPDNSSSGSRTDLLRAKLLSGRELMPSELESLKNRNPDLYRQALKVDRDREAYRLSLPLCQTKTELVQFQHQVLTGILKEYKKGDPSEALMRVNAIQDIHRKFMHSNEYASLKWV